jgi:hypothetical protein
MCGHFLKRLPMSAIQHDGDGADRLGRAIATVFIVALALMFLYGYLAPFVFG